jgi:aspartokinase-like uncharacterized kinase
MRKVVWKVGGSLLDLPDLAGRISRLLLAATPQLVLLVPGGGAAADEVRRWQQVHGLSDGQAHWLALEALELNAQLLATLLPNARVVSSPVEAEDAWRASALPVLRVREFAQTEERRVPHSALPHDWSVTSDSLAVWIAARCGCERVVLLKSCPVPRGYTAAEAAERGLVDGYFPLVTSQVTAVDWCHLRSEAPLIESWLAAPP